MLPSLRSALFICAALGATIVAPAQADPSDAPLATAAVANLPEVPVPDLLDPDGEPRLSGPDGKIFVTPETEPTAQPEAVPARPKADLATLVADMRGTEPGSRELECLAAGIYFEAKSEPLVGQLAVGQVIANRAESGRFPGSYCGVLFQRGQFSFIRGRSWPAVARSSRQWQNAVAIAKIVDQDLKDSEVGSALFFHARYVSPRWRLKRVAAVGNHIFYR